MEEVGEKAAAAARVEAMSAAWWWVIEWLPKVRARNKCTVDFPPSPLAHSLLFHPPHGPRTV